MIKWSDRLHHVEICGNLCNKMDCLTWESVIKYEYRKTKFLSLAALVFGIGAMRKGGFSPFRIVLAGAAISAFLHAITKGIG